MWKKVKIKDLAEIVSGDTPDTKKCEYYDGEIPWITPKDLTGTEERYISCGGRSLTKAGYDSCAVHMIPASSILLTSRAPIGGVAIAKCPVCTNQGFRSLVPHDGVDPMFLYYALRHNRPRIESAGTGSTFKEVSIKNLGNVEVIIPEKLEEQVLIGNMLGDLDTLRETNIKINNNLAKQARAAYLRWTQESKNEKWQQVQLGEVVLIQNNSFYPEKNPGIWMEHYSIPAYDKGKVPVGQWSDQMKSSKFVVEKGAILVSKLNPTNHRLWDIRSCNRQAVCSSEFMVYRAKKPEHREYLRCVLDSEDFVQFLSRHLIGASRSRQRVSPKETLRYSFRLPPDDRIGAFSEFLTPIYERMWMGNQENARLESMRDAALQAIFAEGEASCRER